VLRTALLDSVVELNLPPGLRELLAPLLSPVAQAAPTVALRVEQGPDGFLVLDQLGTRAVADEAAAVEAVLEICNREVLAGCVDVAVHAGVVARRGRVLAVPAASGGGKTTLVAALLRDGWEYVSDEALVLAPGGAVRPYAKWLSVHAWTLDRLGLAPPPPGRQERAVPPSEVGAVATGPLALAHVLLVERGPASVLRPAGRAGAAAELLRCSFNHYRDPAGSVARVAAAVAGAQAWRLQVDDPVEASALLSAELG